MVLKVVGQSVSATISALADTVELHLRLMIDDRGVLRASYSIAFLLFHVDQAKGFSIRLKGIKVGTVLEISSEVLVSEPQYSG